MKGFIKWCDKMPKLLKFILALPIFDLFWNIYRTVKSIVKKNTLGIVLGLLLIFVGWAFMWVIDIITVLLKNKILWLK